MTVNEKTGRKRAKALWWKIPAAIAIILTTLTGIYGFSIYSNAKQTVEEKIHEPVKSIDISLTKKKIKEARAPLNILLMGVDERTNDPGRSDAIMVLSLDPQSNSMKLVSIPRDTRTEIAGLGFKDKINHAFAFGGAEGAILTVENLLDIELDHYIAMNMEGLTEMVDAVGGIVVNNQLEWIDEGSYQKGFHYQKGELHLNGAKTLGYVRMRHQDPSGDFGRTKRQRQVIQAIIDKGASVASIHKLDDIITTLGHNFTASMDFADMQELFLKYRNTRKNVVSYQMKGQGTHITNNNGKEIYYLIIPQTEIAKVRNMMKEGQS